MAAYSEGVSPPRLLWGRQLLYSFLQSSMTTRASVSEPNSVMFNSSSRARPLNDSIQGFSHGEPGFEVDGAEPREPAPISQRPGDQCGPVVHPQMLRGAPLGDETFQAGHDPVGAHGTAHFHSQSLAGARQPYSAASTDAGRRSRRTGSRVPTYGGDVRPAAAPPLSCRGSVSCSCAEAAFSALFSPQTADLLVLDRSSLTAENVVGLAPSQPGRAPCEPP